jgi:ABC-type dipeptide/oligopeptide/nickel transport system permease subunit
MVQVVASPVEVEEPREVGLLVAHGVEATVVVAAAAATTTAATVAAAAMNMVDLVVPAVVAVFVTLPVLLLVLLPVLVVVHAAVVPWASPCHPQQPRPCGSALLAWGTSLQPLLVCMPGASSF